MTGIISIWRWAKNATNVSLHGCIFAIKHYFDKSLESQPLLHVLCCKKCSRSFKILQLQRLGINSNTHTHTHELIAITLRLRARVNYYCLLLGVVPVWLRVIMMVMLVGPGYRTDKIITSLLYSIHLDL